MANQCFSRMFGLAICLGLVGLGLALGVYYGVIDEDALPDAFPKLPENFTDDFPDIDFPEFDLDIFKGENPFQPFQSNPLEANKWKNDGSGLELKLINALDTEWYDYFDIAVREWEEGNPDALTLSTEVAKEPDFDCTDITGIQKVCNGDYGETDWKGINKVLLQNGWIIASMARMNDHFFKADGSDTNKRQYTMCHELGHGFGLPHTDENFWNRALGNCLDYTNDFAGNKSPDDTNYQFLTDLYGSVDGTIAAKTADDKLGAPTATESKEDGGRNLRHGTQPRHLFESVQDPARRLELVAAYKEIDAIANRGLKSSQPDPRWRLLHRNEYGEAHEITLGDGYFAQVHMLLA